VEVELYDQADDDTGGLGPGGRARGANQRACSHAKAATRRAVITITADHPSWGDAWVVRRTALCGNVVECRHCYSAAGMGVPWERGEEVAMLVISQARLEPRSNRRELFPALIKESDRA
jgi:hypothetical protein